MAILCCPMAIRIVDVVKGGGAEDAGESTANTPDTSTSPYLGAAAVRRLSSTLGGALGGSGGSFASYVIQCDRPGSGGAGFRADLPGDPVATSRHRYSDFELLHAYLQRKHPFVCVPSIPGKQTLLETLGTLAKAPLTLGRLGMDPETVQRRRLLLGIFLERLVRKPILMEDDVVQAFLGLAPAANWKELAVQAEPPVPHLSETVATFSTVEQAAAKHNQGSLCCVEPGLVDLEASLVAFCTVLSALQSSSRQHWTKLTGMPLPILILVLHAELTEDLRDLGTALNGFSVEFAATAKAVEAAGERLDRESSTLASQVVRFYEPFADRLQELQALGLSAHRALLNVVALHVQLQQYSLDLHAKRADLLQVEADESHDAALYEELQQDILSKQHEADRHKHTCLDDIRQTQWTLADDLRDLLHEVASTWQRWHDDNQDK